MTVSRKLFVNMSVRDLPSSRKFFESLGFGFNEKFSNHDAACMIFSGEAYAMLITETFFRSFTTRQICDTTTHVESLLAISCESREEVDALVQKALDAGGKPAMPAVDHGFMYYSTFYDLDGHHWEVMWMDPKAAEGGPPDEAMAPVS